MTLAIATFLISAAALALELVLVRALSIGHWHHFSYLVISTALLGFGAGAALVTVAAKPLTKHCIHALWLFAFAFAAAAPLVFWTAQKVSFDELQLIWDRRQILYLTACYLLFFAPFFCAGAFVALAFAAFGQKAHRLYFYNMAGSGLGAVALVALMYAARPESLILLTSLIAFLSAATAARAISLRRLALTAAAAAICLWAFSTHGLLPLQINISQQKSLLYYKNLPQAKTLARRYSPLARLDCIQAPAIRYFPGLSFAYRGKLPRQMLIISDADAVSAVNKFDHLTELSCYDHTTSALPYHLLSDPHVCIIGAGGGSDLCQALALGAHSITAVEMNSQIVDLVADDFNDFASGLYRRNNVQVVIAEGRNFLETTPHRFDIINISLLDSFSASAAGLYALNESHLYTIEAVGRAISRLKPSGLLSITRVLKTPARDSLKILATVADALRSQAGQTADISRHIIMIRSWATATIVASPQPLAAEQIQNARSFAAHRSFDLIHTPAITLDQTNKFHILDEGPVYYRYAQQILSDNHEEFYDTYAYKIRPATDDRPYFFDFFKWRSLPHMIRTLGHNWLIFSEWGYLVLVATLLQAVAASVLLILLPLRIARPLRKTHTAKAAVLLYFLLLGLAYMFLEMGFIQKMTLLIGHPVYGVAVTLLAFLLFSGLGSLAAELILPRLAPLSLCSHRLIWAAAAAVTLAAAFEIALTTLRFDWLLSFSRPARLILAVAIAALPAFFMGMPMPTALKHLHLSARPLVPWAWGVNGCASVTGAVLGTILAISLGFTTLALIALTCYILAALLAKSVCSPPTPAHSAGKM